MRISRPTRLASLLALAASATLWACDSGTSMPTDPDPTPAVSISAAPTSLSLEQGASGTVTVTVTRSGGFTGSVALTASGLPSGVTADAPSGTGATLVMTLSAGASAATGSSSVTITASGSGVSSATTTLNLTVTEKPVGSFALSASPGSLSVEQGSNGTATVSISRTSPFSGAVALAVSGAPSGVTVTADPASVTGTSSSLTIAVSDQAEAGTATLTITGTASGVADATATLALTVTAKTQQGSGSFALSVDPASLTLQQGQSGTVSVGVTRTDPFAGAVDLTVSGAPAGVTVTADPTSVTGGSSTLTVAVGSGATAGSYTLTVSGAGQGVDAQSVTFGLTVQSAPSGGASHSWSFCPTTPSWFAVKDGDGAWTPVSPSGNTFTFSASSDKVGVAYVIVTNGNSELNMRFASQDELDEIGPTLCRGSRSVTGSVVGLSATGTAFVSMGSVSSTVVGSTGTSFTLSNIQDGTVDLFAARNSLNLGTFSLDLDKVFIQRGLDPAGGSSVSVDFTGANAFDPGSATVTATGQNGDGALLTMIYLTSGNQGVLTTETSYSAATSRAFPTVPADKQADGDLHGLTLTTQPDGGTLGAFRSASIYFKDPTDRSVAFGPNLGTTTITTATTSPYLRPRVQYTRQTEYNRYWYGSYQQTSGGATRNVLFYITDDYQGSQDIDFMVPDFSGVAGWDNSWGLATGQTINYAFVTSGWDGVGGIAPATVAAGLQIMTGSRTGQINP